MEVEDIFSAIFKATELLLNEWAKRGIIQREREVHNPSSFEIITSVVVNNGATPPAAVVVAASSAASNRMCSSFVFGSKYHHTSDHQQEREEYAFCPHCHPLLSPTQHFSLYFQREKVTLFSSCNSLSVPTLLYSLSVLLKEGCCGHPTSGTFIAVEGGRRAQWSVKNNMLTDSWWGPELSLV